MSDPSAAIAKAIAPLGWKRRDDPSTDKGGRNISTEVFECGDLRMTITIDQALTRRDEMSGWKLDKLRGHLKTIDASDPNFEFVTQLVREREQRWREGMERGMARRLL
jgi:hypothetical protein